MIEADGDILAVAYKNYLRVGCVVAPSDHVIKQAILPGSARPACADQFSEGKDRDLAPDVHIGRLALAIEIERVAAHVGGAVNALLETGRQGGPKLCDRDGGGITALVDLRPAEEAERDAEVVVAIHKGDMGGCIDAAAKWQPGAGHRVIAGRLAGVRCDPIDAIGADADIGGRSRQRRQGQGGKAGGGHIHLLRRHGVRQVAGERGEPERARRGSGIAQKLAARQSMRHGRTLSRSTRIYSEVAICRGCP